MYKKLKDQPVKWMDRTLSILRAGRLETCEKELAGLGGCGLFDAKTTDLDAERLFELSWMTGEEKSPRLHSIEEMRAEVLGQFSAEFSLLSPEEFDLAFKLAVFGGEAPLYDENDLIPALSLIKRLWCWTDPTRKNRIVMSRPICLATMLMAVSDEAKKVREITEEIVDTVDNTLYLAGAMPADIVIRDMGWKLQNSIAADKEHLYRRMLMAAFETALDQEGRMMLVHPGLADPQGFLRRPERMNIGQDQQRMEEIYDSLMKVEDPLYEKMLGAIGELTRPETGAEDTVEDLILLAKQGAPLKEMQEVLASRIICLPTEGMLSALGELHDQAPKWLSLNMTRVQ